MLSLGDDILKFDKLAQTLQGDMISLDERFAGGGLTIQDILEQNRLIITQMRNIKDVFHNYCKLNQKVYNKILEHQSTSNDQMKKIINAQASIDKKLTNISDDFTIAQEKLSKFHDKKHEKIQGMVKDIEEQLAKKISSEGFSDRIKKIIDEYDNGQSQGHSNSVEQSVNEQAHENQQVHENKQVHLSPENQLLEVKAKSKQPKSALRKGGKKGLTIEDINHLKDEITPLIDKVSVRVDEQTYQIQCLNGQVERNRKRIVNLDPQIVRIDNDRLETIKIINEKFEQGKQFSEQILEELRCTINSQVWVNKFEQFNLNVVKPQNNKIVTQLTGHEITVNQSFQSIKTKLLEINKKTEQLENSLELNTSQIKKLFSKSQAIEQELEKNHEEALNAVDLFKIEREKAEKSMLMQIIESIQREKEQRLQEQKNIKGSIANIVQSTEGKVMKKVEVRFSKELKEIRLDIVSNNRKITDINSTLSDTINDVTNIKETVSKKANFTDLIGSLDKKVDKAEYKDIQELINSPKGSLVAHDSRKSTPSGARIDPSKQRKRKTSFVRGNSMENRFENNSGKLLSFGFEISQGEESKNNFFRNIKTQIKSRQKTHRPSTANTIFML